MNEFDLEKAKRGEPIDQIYKGGRINVDFIGASKRDDSIVVVDDGVRIFIVAANELRMRQKPMKRMWVQLSHKIRTVYYTQPCSTPEEARNAAGDKKIGVPQQIEVPEDYV